MKRVAVFWLWLLSMVAAGTMAMRSDPDHFPRLETTLSLIDYLSYSNKQINELASRISISIENDKSMIELQLQEGPLESLIKTLSMRIKILALMQSELFVHRDTKVMLAHVVAKLEWIAHHRARRMSAQGESQPGPPVMRYGEEIEEPVINVNLVTDDYLLQDVMLNENTYCQDVATQSYVRTLLAWVMQRYLAFYQSYVALIFESLFAHATFENSKSVIAESFHVDPDSSLAHVPHRGDREPSRRRRRRPHSAISHSEPYLTARPPPRSQSAPYLQEIHSPMPRRFNGHAWVTPPPTHDASHRSNLRAFMFPDPNELNVERPSSADRPSCPTPSRRFAFSPNGESEIEATLEEDSREDDAVDSGKESEEAGKDFVSRNKSPSLGLLQRSFVDPPSPPPLRSRFRNLPPPAKMPRSATRWDTLVSPMCKSASIPHAFPYMW